MSPGLKGVFGVRSRPCGSRTPMTVAFATIFSWDLKMPLPAELTAPSGPKASEERVMDMIWPSTHPSAGCQTFT